MKKLFAAILITLGSCSGADKQTAEVVVYDLTGEVVLENVFLGAPNDILLHGDLMLIHDEHDNKVLSIVDLKKASLVGRYLSEGRGPGEVIRPRFSIHEDWLYAHQMNTGSVNVYSLPEMEYLETVELDGTPGSSMRTSDYFVGESSFGSENEGRLQIFDTVGKYLMAGSDWPEGDNIETAFASVAYQGDYCVHPTKNRYAFAATYSDKIEFHEIRRGEHVLLRESGDEKVRADFDDTGNARLAPNVFMGSAGMYGGKEYCYVAYIGQNRDEEGVKRGMSDRVLQYDWEGNPVAEYKLDRQIAGFGFVVDETSGYLYALALDPESEAGISIVRFGKGE